ncbi:MAG: VCBS repeat-containing protein [Desulfobacterium sp.]|nr:VCBS repeat-containing protein [Desulfobacterium sp.]
MKIILMACCIFLILPYCATADDVREPVLLKQIKWTGTSWYGSPVIHDLGTGEPKLIGTFYSIFVWDKDFNQLAKVPYGSGFPHRGRIYPPAVCADLEGDGIFEIIVGSTQGSVAAYEWRDNTLSIKAGWPASACDAGQCPEVRGMAADDLDNDGDIEIIVTTTQTNNGAQVFVFNPDGSLYQPVDQSCPAWPRYRQEPGPCGDAHANGPGNHGYGCFGLNVGTGNLDDDPDKEIVVTFDNHQINVFDPRGSSMLASDYFTNRSFAYSGNRLNWGQFIRWFDFKTENHHYHLHTNDWPHPVSDKWMQWTSSPPNVVDVNHDGKNEVVCVANVEKDLPYDTKHHSIMVLEGSYTNGPRSARRLPGWETLPSSGSPLDRGDRTWYPPRNPPAPVTVNILGDARPETIYAAHDGYIYCTSPLSQLLWEFDFTHNRALMYASEVMVADLNQDNVPELVFTTYGDPENITPGQSHGYLMILDANGTPLFDMELPQQGTNGNGKGAPAAPTIMDLNQDGNLEIIVQTFGAGMFIYSVPGSAENQLLWPTGRGNYLRNGQAFVDIELFNYDLDRDGDVDGMDLTRFSSSGAGVDELPLLAAGFGRQR